MLDEIEGRLWSQHGKAFGDAVAGIIGDVWQAFVALHAITWHKPWDAQTACGSALPKRER